MKKLLPIALVILLLTNQHCNSLKKLGWVPSELEMITGLKDALSQGLFRSFNAFSNPEGNPLVRFILPGEAEQIERALKTLGLEKVIDQVTGKFTRAMSSAVSAAKPLFVDALKNMSVRDATKILVTDNPHAATDYFKQEMKPGLMIAFRPIVDSSIRVEGADREWTNITAVYNSIPFLNKPLENNLTEFISARAIDVMFLIVANEESQIRSKYELRKTDMMRKVFAWAEQELKKKMRSR